MITPQGSLASWEVDRLLLMRKRGMKPAEIAAHVGLTKRSVYRYLRPPKYRCSHCGERFRTSALAFEHAVESADDA